MSIEITRLDNGLRIASDLMPGIETVSLGIWVAAGTRHEPAAINGVAHLLEHMAFKGTRRRSAFDIARDIEAVGGHLNAYTSRENTAYYAKVLAGDAPLAVDILSDILQHSVFDEGELERERAVVLQEIGQAEDTPDDIIFDRFQEAAYPDQPMGRPVLGRDEVVSKLDRTALLSYMARSYGAEGMIFAAAGKADHARLVDQVASAMGDLPAVPEHPLEPARYNGGETREERELEQVHILLGFQSVPYGDPDYYAASVYSTLLGGGMSSRLFQEVREKRGLVYSIYSFTSSYSDGGLFGVYAGTGPREVSELVPVVCDELAKTKAGIRSDELAAARAQLKASLLMSRESSSSRAEQLAQQLLIYGRPVPVEEVVAKVDAVDEAAIERFAARLLSGQPTLAAIGPIGDVEPFEHIAARLA